MDKEKFYAPMGGRSLTASSKRSAQLRNWDSSATNKESDAIKPSRLRANVQFGDTVVFLAAAMSGDVEDVERLVAEGADVNAINSDGLTGLHQVRTSVHSVYTHSSGRMVCDMRVYIITMYVYTVCVPEWAYWVVIAQRTHAPSCAIDRPGGDCVLTVTNTSRIVISPGSFSTSPLCWLSH